jgi:hypothetical protein
VKITTIAAILAAEMAVSSESTPRRAVRNITYSLADAFAQENPNFDRGAFYSMVGLDSRENGDETVVTTDPAKDPNLRATRSKMSHNHLKAKPPQNKNDPRCGIDYWGHVYRTDWSVSFNYMMALQKKFPDRKWEIENGTKFDKITSHLRGGTGGDHRVHCFVHRNRETVIKPASPNAPQKEESNAVGFAERYDLSTSYGFRNAIDAADEHGAYLYKKTRTRKNSY